MVPHYMYLNNRKVANTHLLIKTTTMESNNPPKKTPKATPIATTSKIPEKNRIEI